ncbi:AAA family ATPase [Povalibacter sp.]|uniref:AAA family ATPase n=1 Tax=Povalibacter sp. TaxID=1962978 RepID=UPI002F40563D
MTQAPPTTDLANLHFGLVTEPFADDVGNAFFPSDQHVSALDFMAQVLWSRARLGVLTAGRGFGKSTLIARFLQKLDDRFVVASITLENLSARDFLLDVLRQFGIALEDSDKTDRRRLLERFLHHQAAMCRVCMLVVENPQQMHPSVLEELRLLTSLEADGRRVLKVLLLGEPPIDRVVESPRMVGLLAGGAMRFALETLSEDQTAAYVAHRLRAAGSSDPDALIPHTLMPRVYACTAGVPAQINRLCARALACAAEEDAEIVTSAALDRAIDALGWQARINRNPAAIQAHRRTDVPEACGKLVLSMQGMPDREVLLDHDRVLIGRGEEADARIDSVFVSRYHALVVRHDGQDLLLDLGSTNGLLFNSRRVLRRILKDGDLIQVGPARMQYVNPLAVPSVQLDPAETICFARPGFPSAAGEDEGNGTIIAFGHTDTQTPSAGR